MKTIYFISNNLISKTNIKRKAEMISENVKPLSLKGEEEALKLATKEAFKTSEIVYSSTYASSLNTAKYFSELHDLELIVTDELDERIIGDLCANEYNYLKGMQEHDFDYKLYGGESINEVKLRMTSFVKEILNTEYETMLVVSHHIALMSLFLNWCQADFNLNDELILEYKEDVIFDGTKKDIDVIKVEFDGMKIVRISKM